MREPTHDTARVTVEVGHVVATYMLKDLSISAETVGEAFDPTAVYFTRPERQVITVKGELLSGVVRDFDKIGKS